jgi:hypothetical protein
MQIWVDADACPGEVKELLYRAAQRTQTKVTLVANQALRTPRSEFIDSLARQTSDLQDALSIPWRAAAQQHVLGVCWIVRDSAEVEDWGQFPARTLN